MDLAAMGWGLGPGGEGPSKGARVKQGVGSREASKEEFAKPWVRGTGTRSTKSTHTQGVLDVDKPAVKTKKLSNLDQPVGHCLEGALIPGQEGFTEPASLLPLSDKGPCETRSRNGCTDGSPLTQGSDECASRTSGI